jgi:peroxiredoxin
VQQRDQSSPVTERPLVRAGIALVLIAIIAGVFFAVRVAGDDDEPGETAAPSRTGTPAEAGDAPGPLTSGGPIVGREAPDFALRNAEGEIVRLGDLRGKVVFVNFWATWCGPCKEELPDIQKLYDEKRAEGLEVLAVNYQDNAEDARAFFTDLGIDLPMLLDSNGAVYDQYRLQGLPDSFFIDRDGNLAAVHYGFLNEDKMRQRLEQAGLP